MQNGSERGDLLAAVEICANRLTRCRLQDVHPSAAAIKRYYTRRQGEQGVILTAADIAAGVEVRSALPNDDAAGQDAAARVDLDAQPLSVALAAVANRTLTFLMSHVATSSLLC